MKRLISLVLMGLALASVTLMAGCNTVHGVGQDVSAAGHGIQKAADK